MAKPAPRPAETPSSGDSYAAFVQAKRRVADLAGVVALDRAQRLYVSYVADGSDPWDKPGIKELVAVAPDAWPALREEWKAYRPGWHARMVARERAETLWSEGKPQKP